MLRKLLFLLPSSPLLLTACGDDLHHPAPPRPNPAAAMNPPAARPNGSPSPPARRVGRAAARRHHHQLLVYSFADSDGDGTGDLPGLTARLDYLDRMGVSALCYRPSTPPCPTTATT